MALFALQSVQPTLVQAAMMFELSQKAQTGQLKLEFPEKKDERLFAVCKEAFQNGQTVAKTAAYSPTAFMAAIEARAPGFGWVFHHPQLRAPG